MEAKLERIRKQANSKLANQKLVRIKKLHRKKKKDRQLDKVYTDLFFFAIT